MDNFKTLKLLLCNKSMTARFRTLKLRPYNRLLMAKSRTLKLHPYSRSLMVRSKTLKQLPSNRSPMDRSKTLVLLLPPRQLPKTFLRSLMLPSLTQMRFSRLPTAKSKTLYHRDLSLTLTSPTPVNPMLELLKPVSLILAIRVMRFNRSLMAKFKTPVLLPLALLPLGPTTNPMTPSLRTPSLRTPSLKTRSLVTMFNRLPMVKFKTLAPITVVLMEPSLITTGLNKSTMGRFRTKRVTQRPLVDVLKLARLIPLLRLP